jgi:hypothetical protein
MMGKSDFEQLFWDMAYAITMAIMVFSLQRNIAWSAWTNGNLNHSWGPELNNRMLKPSVLSKQSCTRLKVLWCMPPCIGMIEGRM